MGNGGAARGARIEGGVEPRGDSIRISFQWRRRRCRETIALPPTAGNLKYAERLRGEILRKIELGTFNYAEYFPDSVMARQSAPAQRTFKQVAEAWLAGGDLAKSTVNGYRKILNATLYPKIGDDPFPAISYLRLTELLAGDWSKKTRNNVLICIRRPFDIAHIDGLIESNPAARLRYLKAQVPPPDPFDPVEADAIIDHMATRYGPQAANYAGVGFYVGCRPSEQIAISWDDMGWTDRILRIQRARVLHEVKDTKTSRARDHELSARAQGFIEAQRQHTQLARGLVFMDPVTGGPYNDEKPFRERYWRPTLTALKMRYREPYQMRHTYATMAIMAENNPAWVARQMGNSPQIMFRHYARWIERVDRGRERNKLDAFLGQKWGKPEGNSGGSEG